jgi:hypothetical protein
VTHKFEVGQRVRAVSTIEDDLRDHGLGVALLASPGTVLFIRSHRGAIDAPDPAYRVSRQADSPLLEEFLVWESELEAVDGSEQA